jgi:hypothetical protein
VVIPTIGWRWLIRIASIPGIILIMAFKVSQLLLLPPAGPLTFTSHKYRFYVHLFLLLESCFLHLTIVSSWKLSSVSPANL